MPKVKFKGDMVSIYHLAQVFDLSTTTLYRLFHSGITDADQLVNKAREHRVKYKNKYVNINQLCVMTRSDYRSVKRRLDAGVSVEDAVADLTDRRGNTKSAKLCPSDVLAIYTKLFNKEMTQGNIAREYGIHQSTVSDIWRGKRWDWLTNPLRYKLENQK